MLEIAKKIYKGITSIYNGITNERFSRLYLMFVITAFGSNIMDKPMVTDTSRLDERVRQIRDRVESIDSGVGSINSRVDRIQTYGVPRR